MSWIIKYSFTLIFIILLISSAANYSLAQVHIFKEGAYITAEDFINNSPSFLNCFKVIERNSNNVNDFGGSEYKIVTTSRKLKKKQIKYGLWGVVFNGALYINNHKFSFNPGYNKVVFLGNDFVYLIAIVDLRDEVRMTHYYLEREKKLLSYRHHRGVVYSFSKQKFYILSDSGMYWLIKDYPDLLKEFNELLETEYINDDYEINCRFNIIKKLDEKISAKDK